MAGIPAWALALGGLKIAPEMANEWAGFYKNVRDIRRGDEAHNAEQEVLSDFTRATGPEDVEYIQSTIPRYGTMGRDAAKDLYAYGGEVLKQFEKKDTDENIGGAYAKLIDAYRANPNAPLNQVAANFTPGELRAFMKEAGGKMDDWYKAQSTAEKITTDATDREAKAQRARDISDFQSAIGGITGPSTSPVDLRRFAARGGYAPFSDVESDIRQAASAYNVGDSDEVNKAITAARDAYKSTFLPAETVNVGRTTATGQRNLLGDFRKDVQNTAPVVNIRNDGIREDRLTQSWYDRYQKHPVVKSQQEGLTYANGMESMIKEVQAGRIKNLTASDEMFVRGMLRALEPDSVVMISEGKSLESNAPLINKARGALDRVAKGGKMFTDDERQAIVQTLRVYRGAIGSAKRKVKSQFEKAMPKGVDRATVFMGDIDDEVQTGTPAPKPGKQAPPPVAPAGTRIKTKDGKVMTSDGKGGWR